MHLNVISILLLFLAIPVAAGDLTGTEIVQRVNDVINQDQMRAIMTLTITTTTGQQRRFVYESFSKDRGEKTLMRYLEPSRVRDQAILMTNNADDIWTYFPRTKRVRKLATHAKKQKMEGSDFAYEDMGSGDSFLTDFVHRRLEDRQVNEDDCFQVELTIKPDKESSYSRIVVCIDKSSYVILAADYYDENHPDIITKRLTVNRVETIQGIPTATEMTMRSLDDNTETSMSITSVDYRVTLPDDLFTERGLRQ